MLHQDLGRRAVPGPRSRAEICHASKVRTDMQIQPLSGGCLRWAYRSIQARYYDGMILSGPYATRGVHECDVLKHRCVSNPYSPRWVAHPAGRVHVTSAADPSSGSTVLLVESPAKARKLQQFLGNQYKVLAWPVSPALVPQCLQNPGHHIFPSSWIEQRVSRSRSATFETCKYSAKTPMQS